MYCTVEQLKARYGEQELLNHAYTSSGELNVPSLEAALTYATQLMNNYLPDDIDTTKNAALLEGHCGAIARHYIYADRATDRVREMHEDALKWLREVTAGNIQLDTVAADTDTGAGATAAGDDVFFGSSPQTVAGK